jgi:DMSO/TMAO reductase YedYZ heme-binding membrane subunit
MAVRIQTLSQTRRPNVRAWLAFLFGVVAAGVIPAAIELTRKVPGAVLLDAVWSIPVAAGAAAAALLFARGAHGAIARTLERAGGATWIRLGRLLAVTGICFTLSASIAVGLYELLLRLEH